MGYDPHAQASGCPPSYLDSHEYAYIWYANFPARDAPFLVGYRVVINVDTQPPPAELAAVGVTYQRVEEVPGLPWSPVNLYSDFSAAVHQLLTWQNRTGLLMARALGGS